MTETTKQKTVKDAYEYFFNNYLMLGGLGDRYRHINYNPYKNEFYLCRSAHIALNHQVVCTREEFEAYAKEQKQNDKPVYTQEMADKGELPPVGSECMIKLGHEDNSHFNKGYIIGLSKCSNWLVFSDYLDNLNQHNIEDGVYRFKPIDTRTDEEKLIDEMENLITEHCDSNGTLRDLPRTFLEHYDITPK